MKRIILEVVLGVLMVAFGAYGFMQMTEVSELEKELNDVAQLQEETNKLKEELAGSASELETLRVKGRILEAIRSALSSGIALKDIEAAAKAEVSSQSESPEGSPMPAVGGGGMNPDRLLAIGALRMLIYGETDQKALSSFEKALDMVDLRSKLKAVCAAQAGIAASGKQINILSECLNKEP